MTNVERRTAFDLRLAGRSWEEIGTALGYTAPTVFADLQRCIRRTPRRARCVYPALEQVLTDRYDGRVTALAAACGLPLSTVYAVLSGRCRMTEQMAAQLARATGLGAELLTGRREVHVPL